MSSLNYILDFISFSSSERSLRPGLHIIEESLCFQGARYKDIEDSAQSIFIQTELVLQFEGEVVLAGTSLSLLPVTSEYVTAKMDFWDL